MNYDYNIKGALTNINNPDSLEDDLFGMNLFYDTNADGFGNTVYEDGKISAMQWNSKNLNDLKTYTYKYDALNRLTSATYYPALKYNVNITYDLNGNITHLIRGGEELEKSSPTIGPPSITSAYNLIDDLTYTYGGNRLISVSDAIGNINTQLNNDFRDNGEKSGQEYFYDENGNMIADLNKGINHVKYNHLNQPTGVKKDNGNKTEYTYTATGIKLKTLVYENSLLKSTTEYSGAYVYVAGSISFTNIPGGRIVAKNNEYQYNLTDHLGNVRVTFKDDGEGNAGIIQEDHYYPFGMRMNGQHFSNTDLLNKFLYNGKELQDQTNYLDYGFRQMDPQLGRWHVVDAMAEKYLSSSPYAYTENDPINHIDVLGLQKYSCFDKFGAISAFHGGDDGGMWGGGGGGGSGSRGIVSEAGPTGALAALGNLMNSTYGGTWSINDGVEYFTSDAKALEYARRLPPSISGLTQSYLIQNGKSNATSLFSLLELGLQFADNLLQELPQWRDYFLKNFNLVLSNIEDVDDMDVIAEYFDQYYLTTDQEETPSEYEHCQAYPLSFRFDINGEYIDTKPSNFNQIDGNGDFIMNQTGNQNGYWFPIQIGNYQVYFHYCVICDNF